jgi:hypothetical protein
MSTRTEAADYIRTLATELIPLAQSARLDTIAHLLEMVRFEARERDNPQPTISPNLH